MCDRVQNQPLSYSLPSNLALLERLLLGEEVLITNINNYVMDAALLLINVNLQTEGDSSEIDSV